MLVPTSQTGTVGLLLQAGGDGADIAGVRAAHAEDAVHALLLVGGRIDHGHHEVVGGELIAAAHQKVPAPQVIATRS